MSKQVLIKALSASTGVRSSLGIRGTTNENYRLLRAIDLCGRRYARLQSTERQYASETARVVYVPWIAAFAALVERAITVTWVERKSGFFVSDGDGEVAIS